MLTVTLYTRPDCHLCDQARSDLQALQEKYPHLLVEVDIEQDDALQRMYLTEIPVVEVGPYRIKAPFDLQKLTMTLGAASDRRDQLEQLGGDVYAARVKRGQEISMADRAMFWISKHYLALMNVIILIYVGLPFLAPVLMEAEASTPARLVYAIYSPLCHQFGFRSFYLFGEQAYYPLREAGLPGVLDFEKATGISGLHDPNDYSRLVARQYVGNETIGFKVALCERDVAIYGAILFFGLLFGLTGRRFPQLHWLVWILLGLGPVGLDGFSQLFSQFDWNFLATWLPYRESTPFLRVLTGSMFGFFTAWFAYPNIEESMRETRQFFLKKFAVVNASAE
jgi:uncharacterized membrane protein